MHGDSLYWKYGGILFWTDFWFNMLLTFKASMRFLVSVGSPTLTALKSLFEEISKIIPWSRCPGDPTSAKCKVKVDSYKACSRFNGREYSFVRIWWRPNCKLTNGKSPSNETSCISGLLYFLEPWLRCLLLVLSNKFKTFTDWHRDWLDSLCYQCDHCNHMEQQFPAVVSSVLPVSYEKGYSN